MTGFVIDSVGEITNPAGETFKGVILAVPHGTTPEDEIAALRAAARLYAGRVALVAAETEMAS